MPSLVPLAIMAALHLARAAGRNHHLLQKWIGGMVIEF
jgi:hypothetical protein